MTVLKKCTCKHDYQDKRYGKGVRVMNRAHGQGEGKYRCTVCKTIR